MREGAIFAQGPPDEIVDAELVEAVFGLECLVVPCPASHAAMVVPASRPGEGRA
jgi:iron complex transport system ATP-binding protein